MQSHAIKTKSFLIVAWLLFFFGGFCACNKPRWDVSKQSVLIIGHGGSGFADGAPYPPNSPGSITTAIDQFGADGVELDFQMSSDGVLFLFHDQHLDAKSFCSGCVYGWTAEDLRNCRFKTLSGADERIISVEDIISRYASGRRRPLIFLDMKNPLACVADDSNSKANYYHRVLAEIDHIVTKYQAEEWVILQSDSREWLQYLHQRNPRIKLILDYITHEGDIRFAADAGFFGVAAPGSDLSDEEVELARSLGLRIQLYGARLQQDIVRELDKRPDYFLADNILMTQRIRQAGSN